MSRAARAALVLAVLLLAQAAALAPSATAEKTLAREVLVDLFEGGLDRVEGLGGRTVRMTAAFEAPATSSVLLASVEVSRVRYRVHSLPLEAAPQAVWCGDIDGDGAVDDVLVAMPSLGRVDLLTVTPSPLNATLRRSFAVPGASAIAVTDLDLDRDLEIVVASSTDGSLHIFSGLGAGAFDEGRAVQVGPRPTSVEYANVDPDFQPDLVVANSGGSSLTVLHGRGDLTFYPQRVEVGSGPTSVRLVDWDRDTHMDAVVAESRNDTVRIMRNVGNGNLTTEHVIVVPGGPVDVDARDLDGDSLVDVAVAVAGADQVLVLRQRQEGGFETWEELDVGRAPRVVAGIHMNRGEDLLRDVVAVCTGADSLSLRLSEGTTNHTLPLEVRVGGRPVDIATGNLLHDRGQEETLVACQEPPSIAIVEVLPKAELLHVGVGPDGASGRVDLPQGTENATVNLTSALGSWVWAHRSEARGGVLRVPMAVWADLDGMVALSSLEVWCVPDRPPRAWAPADVKLVAGETVTLSGAGSYDPEGQLESLVWRLPDGTTRTATNITLTFTMLGVQTILLQAFDVWGLQDIDSVTVTVNAPPVAAGDVPATARARSPVRLDAYTSSDPDGTIADYIWDWGQGVAHGQVVIANFTGSGTRQVRLEVIDDMGARGVATWTVEVLPAETPVRPPGEQVPADRGEVPMAGAGATTLLLLAAAVLAASWRRRAGRRPDRHQS